MSPETVLGVMPTLQMARGILWRPLVDLFSKTEMAKAVKDIRASEFRIDFHGGKPSIQIAGANDGGDRLRGKRLYFWAADEYQDCKPTLLDEVLLPAMADTPGSRGLITGTPKGKNNILYTAYSRSNLDPSTYSSYNRPTTDNPFVPKAEIDRARLTMPPRVFEQEFYANFVNFPGQFYPELDEGNRCDPDEVPSTFDLTIAGVDFGDVNPAIVILGLNSGRWYYLEGWQGYTGNPIPPEVFDMELIRLSAKYGTAATYCDPSRPSSILGIRGLGKDHGLPGLQNAVAGYNRILEGIYQVSSYIYRKTLVFPRSAIVAHPGQVSSDDAFELMQSYHRATDKDGLILEKPAEGQNDHAVDALRYSIANEKGLTL